MGEPLILIHGGAGSIPDSRVHGKLDGVRRALEIGHAKYAETKNILDATQAAVEYMETDENFNAGLVNRLMYIFVYSTARSFDEIFDLLF